MSNVHGLNTDDDKPPRRGGHSSGSESEDSNEGRQGFFVGGSDRSGQQVLGPNRDDMSSRLFEALQRAGAEKLTTEEFEAMGAQRQGAGTSSGSSTIGGFRLGGHGVQSDRVGGVSAGQQQTGIASRQPPVVVRLIFWRNGFSVDEGPLRQYDDPQSKAFLQAIMSKRVPPELNVPGREIDLRIERKSSDYERPKMKPFSGKGNQLGSVTPNIVAGAGSSEVIDLDPPPPLLSAEESEKLVAQAQADLKVDENQPTTRIQIRIPGAARPIVARLNQHHSIHQLRSFIVVAEPSLAFRPFRLATVYPNKVVEDEEQSVKDAGLLNAAVNVKFETGP